ncbi:MAG: cobalt ECF transporter T component CbiQ [Planctomycetota bacterium]
MELDRFTKLNSMMHRWDARWKCSTLIVFVFLCAAVHQAAALFLVLVSAALLVVSTGIPFKAVIASLRFPVFVLCLMTPILAITSGGAVLASCGFIHLYREGVLLSAVISVRAISIMLIFIALFGTTKVTTLMQAAACLKVPSTLITVVLFTYRYIFQYLEEMDKLFTAARLRGFRVQQRWVRIRSTVSLLTTLLIRSFEQSERVGHAMRMRGFTGKIHAMAAFRTTGYDVALSGLFLALFIAIIFTEVS